MAIKGPYEDYKKDRRKDHKNDNKKYQINKRDHINKKGAQEVHKRTMKRK